jgi:hypothetical protein
MVEEIVEFSAELKFRSLLWQWNILDQRRIKKKETRLAKGCAWQNVAEKVRLLRVDTKRLCIGNAQPAHRIINLIDPRSLFGETESATRVLCGSAPVSRGRVRSPPFASGVPKSARVKGWPV